MILKNKNPMQERLRIGLLLVMNSGFIDSYTFEYHHERFASLQTGNIIQAGFHLAQGHWKTTLFFVTPIIFFVLGAAFNTILNHIFPSNKLSIQQHSILIEFIGIAIIGVFNPYLSSTAIISALSFLLAMQLDSFPKLRGLPFTSVMSTGNLRNVGTNFVKYFIKHDHIFLHNAWVFSILVVFFMVGAFSSAILSSIFGTASLLGSSLIMFAVFLLLFRN
ncbi:DUF1275 family protein [Leuconostoc litchii]|uniref:DUF1275 domain-containing protein n=1 Tax=Leuconostoc litchii TaxID=1981069 RepID=A0A6P2CQT8_9LACO|nr:YoaK family protein [Leuconostoc litchii]TYC47482.1 DUF1275 domain-containing protein [Leuconostoc litchii]GMA69505.1 DUF1275 family protein [Leuconostoc litchii]